MDRLNDPIVPGADGHTLLAPDETVGLRLPWVATRSDLNRVEQENILRAIGQRNAPGLHTLLDDPYLRHLHRDMFGHVWRWAGSYRRRETNRGVDPRLIAEAVRNLISDARYWVDGDPPVTVAARFHHRLVAIHPFPNGNGRHGRIAANYLSLAIGGPILTWGARTDLSADRVRAVYLSALRQADRGRLEDLIAFLEE
jgi:Fic-DOC domain mobile mystery protein B